MLFYLEGRDLVATTAPPARLSRRAVYFLKLRSQVLAGADAGRAGVVSGELSETPLDQLAALSADVLAPLLAAAGGGGRGGGGGAAQADCALQFASLGETALLKIVAAPRIIIVFVLLAAASHRHLRSPP